jgi:quercetin dioxygenase-like cupin family protein
MVLGAHCQSKKAHPKENAPFCGNFCKASYRGFSEENMAEAKHIKWNDIEEEPLSPQIGRQMIVGTNVMVARVLLKKGARVPLHSHHNEQITYVLEGALHFYIDNRELTVAAGEVLCIPPHMPHEAVALEDTVDLDIFNPPRQDWIDKDDAYLRQEAKS